MSREDITDPRVVPRWVEAGVSGVPRAAEWDVSAMVEIPELAGSPEAELGFAVLEEGTLVPGEGAGPPTVLERLAAQLREQLPPPFEAVALRQGPQTWFLGGRRANVHGVELPDGLTATEITVAIGPDGERSVLVDGDDSVELTGPIAEAVERIEAAGRSRQRAFVARAVRAGARWKLTVDPL